MKLQSLARLTMGALLLVSGCGTSNKTDGAPAPIAEVQGGLTQTADGWRFQTASFDLDPGSERYFCYAVTMKEALSISRFATKAHGVVHHLLMSEATVPEPEGSSECDVLFRTTWLPMFFGTTADTEVSMPDGAAKVVSEGTQVVVQLHLVNTTNARVTDAVAVDMTRSTLKNPELVSVFAFGTTNVLVPPKQVTTLTGTCKTQKDLRIFALMPHMHFLGKKMEFLMGPDADHLESKFVRDPYDFNNQFIEKFDVQIPAGTVTQLKCTYDNDRDKAATFGESSYDEMCFAAGLAVGQSSGADGCIEGGAAIPDGGVPRAADAGVCGQVESPIGVGRACTTTGSECPAGMLCSAGQEGAGSSNQGFCIKVGCQATTECGATATCCTPPQGGGLVNVCMPEACRPSDCLPVK